MTDASNQGPSLIAVKSASRGELHGDHCVNASRRSATGAKLAQYFARGALAFQ
jgi:hypothetical protein